MTVHVVNVQGKKRTELPAGGGLVLEYVGRPSRGWPGSSLANPFKIGRDGDRTECLAKYRAWLIEKIGWSATLTESEQRFELRLLRSRYLEHSGLTLGCWCQPDACHADLLAECIVSGQSPDGRPL